MRSVALLVGLFAALVGAAFLFGGVSDERALGRSLAREAGAPFDDACSTPGPCWVADRNGSGGGDYRVAQDGDCWSASGINSDAESPMPERLEGCVALRDRYPFVETLYDARKVF